MVMVWPGEALVELTLIICRLKGLPTSTKVVSSAVVRAKPDARSMSCPTAEAVFSFLLMETTFLPALVTSAVRPSLSAPLRKFLRRLSVTL